MEAFIGTIMPTAFDYAPTDWLPCDGRQLRVQDYQALASLIRDKFGGDFPTTFNLPDLRGRTLVGSSISAPPALQLFVTNGKATGSSSATVNATGTVTATLKSGQLPTHQHLVQIPSEQLVATSILQTTTANGVAEPADGAALGTGATGGGSATIYVKDGKPTIPLQAQSVTTTLAPVSVTTKSTGKNGDSILSGTVTASATVSTLQPSIGLNYIICTQGIYPMFD